jgi:hypothetical protein
MVRRLPHVETLSVMRRRAVDLDALMWWTQSVASAVFCLLGRHRMAQLCDGILPGPQHLEQSRPKDDGVDEQPVSFSKPKDQRTENAQINKVGNLD